MAEGRTKTGVGWETTQHGFKAINYAQTAADVLNQAAEGTLVATGLKDTPIDLERQLQLGESINPWSSPLDETAGWKEWAGDDFDTLANLRPSSDPSVVPVGEAPPGWQETGGRGFGAVGPTAEDMGLGQGAQTPALESLATKGEEVADFLEGASMGRRGGPADPMGVSKQGAIQPTVGKRAAGEDIPMTLPREGDVQPPPGFEDLKQQARAGAQVAPAETWGPGPTEAVMDRQTVPAAETWGPGPTGPPPGFTGVGETHPDVMTQAGAPPAEQDFGQQLVAAVTALLEKMKGFSLSPEEFADITNMSPEQLTEVYNNLARQQGRAIHPDPQAWNLMGGEPFQSQESAEIFQGRVPMSENVIRPGEGEYSQWNIPSRQTSPGFMAQDYAQAQPGTTDWMRQIYPWARNLPENVLQRAIQDGDYLRMLMQKAEAGELLPLM
jgi:hypothetical protein